MMNERLLQFLEKHSILKPGQIEFCDPERKLSDGILDEGSYDVVLSKFEKEFSIELPSGFVEKIKNEYKSSIKPTVRYFYKNPEKSPHGYSENLNLGQLSKIIDIGRWSDDDVHVIPKKDWLF